MGVVNEKYSEAVSLEDIAEKVEETESVEQSEEDTKNE